MITRKENLLIKPFQSKRYLEHRNKVLRALPKIDDATPIERRHISYKHKKLQTEIERHAQIERDNFILLKHLSEIMRSKRIDNYWLYGQPKFLKRIKLFNNRTSSFNLTEEKTITLINEQQNNKRCIACNPNKFIKKEAIPEERIPFEYKPAREFLEKNKKILKDKVELNTCNF